MKRLGTQPGILLVLLLLLSENYAFSLSEDQEIFKLGVIAEEKGQFREAIISYEKVRENSELSPYALIRKARCLLKIGEIESAYQILKTLYTKNADKDVPWRLPLEFVMFSFCISKKETCNLDGVKNAINTLPFLSWWLTPYFYDVGYYLLSQPEYHKYGSEILCKVLDYRGYNPSRKQILMALALSPYEDDRVRVLEVVLQGGELSTAWLILQNFADREWQSYMGAPNEVKKWKIVSSVDEFSQFLRSKGYSKKNSCFLEYIFKSLMLDKLIDLFEILFEQFKDFLSSDEKRGELLYWSAKISEKLQLEDKVEEYFLRFIRDYPEHKKIPDAYFNLAMWYLKNDRKEESFRYLKIIEEKFRSSSYYSWSSYLCGKISEERGDKKNAVRHYQLALKGNIGDYYVYKSAERLYRKFHISSFERFEILPLVRMPVFAVKSSDLQNPQGLRKEMITNSDEIFNLLEFFSALGVEEKEWITFWLISKIPQEAKDTKVLIRCSNFGSPQVVLDFYYSVMSNKAESMGEDEKKLIMYPLPYYDTVIEVAKKYNIDPFLIWSIMRQESTFRTDVVSSSDARGLMQLLPSTAKWVVDKKIARGDKDYRLWRVPEHNIEIGTAYLKYLLEKYDGNYVFAISAYNGGPGNVNKWITEIKFVEPEDFIERIPFAETRNYVKKVLGNYSAYHSIYKSIK